jgi:general secretion pathway protein G
MIIRPHRLSRASARSAFTLLEVLIVVAILVVLAGVGGMTYLSFLDQAKEDAASTQAHNLEKAATAYKIRHGDYPASLDVLTQPDADGGKPTLEPEALMDPWEHAFQYDPSGQQHNGGRKPDVWTTNPSNGKVVGNFKNR